MIDDRVLVRLVDLDDAVPAVAAGHVGIRVEDHSRRENYVVGVKRRAIGPLHAFAQMKGERFAVGADVVIWSVGTSVTSSGYGLLSWSKRKEHAIAICDIQFTTRSVLNIGFSEKRRLR